MKQPHTDAERLQVKRRHLLNAAGIGCVILSVLSGLCVPGLTALIPIVSLPVWLLILPLCAVPVRKTGRCKPLLYTVRGISIGLLCLPCIMTVLCVSFPQSSALHRVRRTLYREGVTCSACSRILMPEQLPDSYSDYSFRIHAPSVLSDTKPDGQLRLYTTDTEWLDRYEASVNAMRPDEKLLVRIEYPAADQSGRAFPDAMPDAVAEAVKETGAQHFVYYATQGDYSHRQPYTGALIDRDTGLLLVWI